MNRGVDLRPITEVAPLVRSGAVSPVDLVGSCLAAIDAGRAANAFITVLGDRANAEAERAARDIAGGRYRGPLHGIPIAVKDLVDVEGTVTTSGSRVPAAVADADAPVVRSLREAGAIVIGKTNLHEFAFGTTSEETAFGPVRHPDDATRVAGGSSGGSAAALAMGMCFGAIGTDTGGSIRIPSAACGTVGLKPGAGELSCERIVPLSTTLDCVGPMTRSVADASLLFHAMKGEPAREEPRWDGPVALGVPRGYFFDRLEPGVRDATEGAIDVLRDAGWHIDDAEIDHARWTPDVYLHICLPEAAWFHGPWLDRHAALYTPTVRLRLEMSRYLLAEDYIRAFRLRDALTRGVERALEGRDALMLPTLPIPAPPIGASTVEIEGVQAPTRAAMLSLTQLFNLTGHPAIALPAGRGSDGLPRGIQIVGHRGRTGHLLQVAGAVERLLRAAVPSASLERRG